VKKRRAFEVFTLSFLDCICCGFGAVVLFYTIVQAQKGAQNIMAINQLTGEVSKLDEEVKEGTLHLVQLRNTLEKTDEDASAAQARAVRVAAELKIRREQSSVYDDESLARNRKYISALQMKGKRILVLLDTSASMMDEDIAQVIKLRNQPEPLRRSAQKWRRALDIVEWITAQLPDNGQFQVIGFSAKAKPVQASTGTQWLNNNDPRAINGVLTAARAITPGDGTSLVNAFLSIRTMQPEPDQIVLITDGLPTQGSVPAARKFINSREREKLFDDAMKILEKKPPMDIVLLPMKGDPLGAFAYWRLARRTSGSYVIPSRDWP
jgi:hypothetical protein